MSTATAAARRGAEDTPEVPATSTERDMAARPGWTGPTYYGRSQLKASPFNAWVVGGYIFLAGLSGASMLLSTIADFMQPEPGRATVRNGRFLSLLAPTLGSPLLIWDLHTPQRFYNMLRIAKHTSPMSIGTWILMGFSGFAGASAAAELFSNRLTWLRWAARIAQVPAALTGAGLGSYTATLLAATSTPFWAAAPRMLAIRFASSSIAAGASALSLLEPDAGMRRRLDAVATVALATELVAGAVADRTYHRTGVADARNGFYGRMEQIGVTGLGCALPIALHAAGLLAGRRTARTLGAVASVATLAGSLMFRVSQIGIGDESARRPEISFRFSQPENLPDKRQGYAIREKLRSLAYARTRR